MARNRKASAAEAQPVETSETENQAVETAPVEAVAKKSIVNAKYRGAYKGNSDFVSGFIKQHCVVKAEGGEEALSADLMLSLAVSNGYKPAKAEAYKKGKDGVGGEGGHGYVARTRMTVANVLRASALKMFGLNDTEGNFYEAPSEFIAAMNEKREKDGKEPILAATHDANMKAIPKAKKKEAEGSQEAA